MTPAPAGWRAWAGPVLAPDGLEARLAAPLAWALLVGGLLLFGAVMLLLWRAVRGPPQPVRAGRWLVGGGLVLPLVVLGALGVANLRQIARLFEPPPAGATLAAVQARLWWWRIRLPDPNGGPDLLLANELVLPVGQPVRLALSSDALIHSLWVPALAGKMDLVPGRIQHLVLQADRPGQWRAPCAEFCGVGHTRMNLQVSALAAPEYAAWLAAQRAPARQPHTAQEQRGLRHFAELRCTACHSVRGVSQAVLGEQAQDGGGPDLTHLASRRMLGAGALPNDAAGLRAWIRDVQQFKPGARMPSYAHLDADTLDALVAYLGSLR